MTSDKIRKKFLDYFEGLGHRIVPSSPVIPAADPTLLFTNAGMNQFKDVFLGLEERPYRRAASVQKCIRAGGKHNDLEIVGRTARHLTFFEMLGNFSFGDYFKEEAIRYAWRFLTDELGIPEERLWVSVFEGDREAERIWGRSIGLPAGSIHRMGEKDNFWSMGDTGPCGPCSEIGIDQGPESGCGRPGCDVGCDCDRYLELWNLVFMQFDRSGSGDLNPLPRPSVDTGMGLERIAAVLQGVPSNFDTDLMRPLIERVGEISGKAFDERSAVSFRVIADHVRSLVFAIVDGVFPSNEGRGYVLRRILRRASRHGRLLGIREPFLHRLVGDVVGVMGRAYPELSDGEELAARIVRGEEERFGQTLDQGLSLFEEIRQGLGDRKEIPGDKVFLLYDTYGFPVDLTASMAEEYNLMIDNRGFEKLMDRQRERARGEMKTVYDRRDLRDLGIEPAAFIGYRTLEGKGVVQRIERDGISVGSATAGEEVAVDLTRTPFYGESGGQLGDKGTLRGMGVEVTVSDTRAPSEGRIIHLGKIREGTLSVGIEVEAQVDPGRRAALMRSHTATHLLHFALRQVLGKHVRQSGSLVAPDRLRFDFTHHAPMAVEELAAVERIVQEKVLSNLEVSISEMSFTEARGKGALAFFGEKYGEQVRVVDVGGVSSELCGGTHVFMTGQIGIVLILSENGISAGVRRIEAFAGSEAFRHCADQRAVLEDVMAILRVPREMVTRRVEEMREEVRELQRSLKDLTLAKARTELSFDVKDLRRVDGIPLLVRRVDVPDMDALRRLADEVRNRLDSCVGVLGSVIGGKAILVVTVTRDLIEERGLDASKVVKEIAKAVEGGGGGKPELAQAGGKRWENLDEALASAEKVVKGLAR